MVTQETCRCTDSALAAANNQYRAQGYCVLNIETKDVRICPNEDRKV